VSYRVVGKIKNVLTKEAAAFVFVKNKLNMQVIMPATGVEVSNSYDNNFLSGIFAGLYLKYQVSTFTDFTNSFVRLIDFSITDEETRTSPMKAVNGIQQFIVEWERRNLWEKLTKDQLFTAILVKSLTKSSAIRHQILNNIYLWSREAEKDEEVSMPLYKRVCDYIENYQDNQVFGGKKSGGGGGGGNKWKSNNNQQLEEAASGEENKGKFKKKFTYVSEKRKHDVCARCYNEDGSSTTSQCKPTPCFSVKCNKCGHYGHKQFACKEMKHLDGHELKGK
jgi:hypothetical protein